MTITITGTEQHLHALRNACELYLRIGLGQFAEVAEQHITRLWEESKGEGKTWYDYRQATERACKSILMPEMPMNASYGVGNKHVSQQAHLCYELWKLLGGGTDGPPLNYSGLPLPDVKVEPTP